MKELLELNQIVYNNLKIQIEFGTYGYGEHLPTMEDMAELHLVSIDTIRHVYRKLQTEGYITLLKSIGTVVKVKYDEEDIEHNIQTFFAQHKDSLLDFCHSMPYLFGGIQLTAWKNISPEALSQMPAMLTTKHKSFSYSAILFLHLVYGSLKNDMLLFLIRMVYIAYLLPFLNLGERALHIRKGFSSIPCQIQLCRQKDWAALSSHITAHMNGYSIAIEQFFQNYITMPAAEKQIPFTWSSYKKTSQLCYSVAFEILRSIVYGEYAEGSFLPSLKLLAEEKHVSVSTIRHTLALLNDLGIIKTINGIGTQILSLDQVCENCNLSNPTVKKRLLDYKQSLQLFALSCRNVATVTIAALDAATKAQWIEALYGCIQMGKSDLIPTVSLKLIAVAAPFQTIKTVYTELYKQLFWGVPFRGMKGTQQTIHTNYLPHSRFLVNALEQGDAAAFAAKLEKIFSHEVGAVTEQLAAHGIQ